MRITALVECSARIMVRLAQLPEAATLSAEKLSDLENISRDYVDQILQRLRRGRLVTSTRGAQGGYSLARPASDISIGMVVRAVEGRVFEEVCDKYSSGEHQCHHLSSCGIRPLWQRLGELIEGYFDQVTLAQLTASEPRVRSELVGPKDFGKDLVRPTRNPGEGRDPKGLSGPFGPGCSGAAAPPGRLHERKR